ncbi:PAS domain S-box protein [Burkholderia cepacia]|jgi:PAS domain S-box-containing protein|uniref:PAS domain S-box protein n=1 Tax=Burkholderia contaminans TaxID=488447 RepID=A0ABD7YG59_9BURK|nr:MULTISPECIES: PAS domain S-box protein [Burkholderia]EKS9799005.1 PAS domain S-box protein [Burkholderia cepacia]EKS9805959.1 PAS domain S-box protein [Burkholderia cepacia]EKS9813507.1 PAS domain S-box protein [Burkholderia cepacia]EKS9820346.1 PAS domain S-box protein [Burkholderia cepacia]EKS9828211.1 PAS domain S-box protein [Burkholderia cepacia]
MSEKTIFAGLKNHFGTPTPIWRYSNHDHVLTLSATGDELDGPAIPIHMTGREAERIRGLTGATSMVTLNLPIYGEHVDLYLVGKRIRADEWAGIAASLWDPESVASITMRAMAFSEGLVSETNAILVVLDKRGTIHRFNRRAEEYTGYREEDVIGENAQELFMSGAAANESRTNISRFFEQGSIHDVRRLINTVGGARPFLFRNRFVPSVQSGEPEFILCSGAELIDEIGAGVPDDAGAEAAVANGAYLRALTARIVDWAALANGASTLLASMEDGAIDPRIVLQAQRLAARAVQDAYELHDAISTGFSAEVRAAPR